MARVAGWTHDRTGADGPSQHRQLPAGVVRQRVIRWKSGRRVARQFLKTRGILVRQMGGYGLPHCLRISIGTEEEMRAVVDAVAAFLKG